MTAAERAAKAAYETMVSKTVLRWDDMSKIDWTWEKQSPAVRADWMDAIAAAVTEERERCLRAAQGPIDSFYDNYPPEWLRGMRETAEGIIKKIGEAQPDFIDKMVAKKIRVAVADALRSHRCPNCGMTLGEVEAGSPPLGKDKLPDPDVMIGGEG